MKINNYLTPKETRESANRFNIAKFQRVLFSLGKDDVLGERVLEWNKYFYERLPKIYRDYDKFTNFQLKRYLETLVEGGLFPLYYDTESIEDLIDPSKCPREFLPLLCEMYGIEYFEDIPEIYQRRFLKILTELYKIKGTLTVIEYIARELSGLRVEVEKVGDEYRIRLQTFEEDHDRLLIEQDIISRYVDQFIPVNVYARVVVSYNFFNERIDKSNENIIKDLIKEFDGEDVFKSSAISDKIGERSYISIPESEKYIIQEAPSSITNTAIIGVNFHTNIIAGIDVVKEGEDVVKEIIY